VRRILRTLTAAVTFFLLASSPAWAGDTLTAGSTLQPGQGLTSQTGEYIAIMQSDGNFVVYKGSGTATWSTNTEGNPGAWLNMQSDGNLVVYSSGGTALWNSQTDGTGSSNRLVMQGDGNLVLYTSSNQAVWAADPSNPQKTYSWIQSGCDGSEYDTCWATDTNPWAGAFGDAERWDDVASMPTTDSNGVSYGNFAWTSGQPATGGDYLTGGGTCNGTGCTPNNPANFAQAWIDGSYVSNEASWVSVLGGANNECTGTTWGGNPCNVSHDLYTYDQQNQSQCPLPSSSGPNTGCFDYPWATSLGAGPGTTNSGTLALWAWQQVFNSTGGPWHGFLCADLMNTVTFQSLEICGETWTTGNVPDVHGMSCTDFRPPSEGVDQGQFWTPLGTSGYAQYVTNILHAEQLGATSMSQVPVGFELSVSTFESDLAALNSYCGYTEPTTDVNDWSLQFVEDGVEGGDAYNADAGITNFVTYDLAAETIY
jgi:hypothetical protein